MQSKTHDKRAAAVAALNNLPPDLGRNRVLDAEASAAYWGISLPHWRRLYRAGKVPRPIKIGERKLGWRIGDLADGLANRANAAA
jgi:predicted DNA-binding transcriptional regulator AlpA